jgi:hypothetical protein
VVSCQWTIRKDDDYGGTGAPPVHRPAFLRGTSCPSWFNDLKASTTKDTKFHEGKPLARQSISGRLLRRGLSKQNLEHQQSRADHNRAVSNIKCRPLI